METTRGKCPFDKKICNPKCVLYRKGMRYWDDPRKEPVAFEECALNIGVDCLENLIGRSIGQQRATEQARNEMAAMKELFIGLANRQALENIKRKAIEEAIQSNKNDVIEVTE